MPFVPIHKYKVVLTDYSQKDIYWPVVTDNYLTKYDPEEIRNPEEISIRLKSNFTYLIELFETKIREKPSASFFMFTHLINDNLNKLYWDQMSGFDPATYGVSSSDLALHRRVYKIILEQFVKLKLYHREFIEKEIELYSAEYIEHLEHLIYLAIQIYQHQDFIAQNNLFPGCLHIPNIDGNFNMIYDGKYEQLLQFAHADSVRHLPSTNAKEILEGLTDLLEKELNINYQTAIGTLAKDDLISEFSYFLLDESMKQISIDIDSDLDGLTKFYNGLTLTPDNVLSVEDTFLRSQENERYIYRPILNLNINDKNVYKTTPSKIQESLMTLSTNAIRYGYAPKEWIVSKKVSKFIGQLMNENDLVLQDPICEIINSKSIKYDDSITSLYTDNIATNINIVKNGPGEIDIIYLNERDNEIEIVICECKNNRFRSDLYNWSRDYSNFLQKYEEQLTRKVEWAKVNKENILIHFERKNNITDHSLRNKVSHIKGIYIVNSATFYMYDGIFDVFTKTSFEELSNGNFQRIEFELTSEETGEKTAIKYPYFRNLGYKK